MKNSCVLPILACFCMAVGFLFSEDTVEDPSTGYTFPKQVTVDHNGAKVDLTLTGFGTRKQFFFKIYSTAHYMENPPKNVTLEDMKQPGTAKQFITKWVFSANQGKMLSEWKKDLSNGLTAEQLEQFKDDIEQFLSFYPSGTTKGDEHIIRWFPDGTLELWINGNLEGSMNNQAFAEALWGMWFGPNSPMSAKSFTIVQPESE